MSSQAKFAVLEVKGWKVYTLQTSRAAMKQKEHQGEDCGVCVYVVVVGGAFKSKPARHVTNFLFYLLENIFR